MKHIANEHGDCDAWCPACGPICAHGENSYECVKCKAENLAEWGERTKEATDLWNHYMERLASEVHRIWADWTQYMLKQLFGEEPIPSSAVEIVQRWYRQMETPYEQLSEQEKESDRQIANRYFGILVPYIQQEIQRQTAACYEEIAELKVAASPAVFKMDEARAQKFPKADDVQRQVASQVFGVPADGVTPEQLSASKAISFGDKYTAKKTCIPSVAMSEDAPGNSSELFTWRVEVDIDVPGDWAASTVCEDIQDRLNEGEWFERCMIISAELLWKNEREQK